MEYLLENKKYNEARKSVSSGMAGFAIEDWAKNNGEDNKNRVEIMATTLLKIFSANLYMKNNPQPENRKITIWDTREVDPNR